jgi:hypothetical protein
VRQPLAKTIADRFWGSAAGICEPNCRQLCLK